jgi:DNA primase
MGLIPQSVIDEVLARTDILQVVQQYVTLKRAGVNYKGLCPFHNEKTPSFNVHPGKGIYKCFGCGAGGNVIGFLMEIEGWSFPESVRHLAEREGVEIPEESDEEREEARKRREAKKAYFRVMQLSQSFYEENLWSDRGRAARQYLQERGVDDETARAFGLGYAPDGWQNLLDHLADNGVPPSWTERAGLALRRRSADGFYDRFRHRIIFPVVDIWGNTLAFGGRVFAANDDGPKYINSSETRYYVKGEHLYGLYPAKQAIQKAEYAILVEGNFDVISLYAAGIQNVVAPMGTAVTDRQARLLGRYCRRVVVAFDGDDAGREATLRCLPALENADIEGRVIRFDDGEDPDTFVRDSGPVALQTLADDADEIVAWALDRALPPAEGGDVRENLAGLEAAGEILGNVKNDVVRRRYAEEISRRLAIEPRLLNEYIKRPRSMGTKIREAVAAAERPLELEPAEFGVLAVLLDRPEWLDGFLSEEYDKLLSSAELADFLHHAADYRSETGRFDAAVLLEHIDEPAFARVVRDALVADELYTEEKARQWYEDCVRSLKRNWANRTLRNILRELETTDFLEERERFEVLNEKKIEVEQFIRSMEVAE